MVKIKIYKTSYLTIVTTLHKLKDDEDEGTAGKQPRYQKE